MEVSQPFVEWDEVGANFIHQSFEQLKNLLFPKGHAWTMCTFREDLCERLEQTAAEPSLYVIADAPVESAPITGTTAGDALIPIP
ncbi:hypothetical protein CRG98_014691 [Punica granatum]|uniref:Uncharacterized protein n=1 Tax=Punica granatum TaxID=22663 RepID=A0A2I0K8M2_PUNGR|nr:hypothetical protein CRG98_014691 [Punica granatum]